MFTEETFKRLLLGQGRHHIQVPHCVEVARRLVEKCIEDKHRKKLRWRHWDAVYRKVAGNTGHREVYLVYVLVVCDHPEACGYMQAAYNIQLGKTDELADWQLLSMQSAL